MCNAVSEIFLGLNIGTSKNKVSFANWNAKGWGGETLVLSTSSMEELMIRPIILYLFQGMVDC